MDYQKFMQQLPHLYEDWGQTSVQSKSDRFSQVLADAQGMTTANVIQLLNFAVSCMEPGEVYCEIGTYQGTTLIGALLDHEDCWAYAVDNFSEFDPTGENLEQLAGNLTKFNLQDRVFFCNQDFQEFFLYLKQIEAEDKIGVYFYDGAHDYRSTLLGLLLAKPFLSQQALIVVDDSNWLTVQQAIWDFIAASPEAACLLNLSTPVARHPSFWNGICILSWNLDLKKSHYDWDTFQTKRQPTVVQALYNVQLFEQREESFNTLYQEAVLAHQHQQWSIAERKYREYLLWKDQDAAAYWQLGQLYIETESYQTAIGPLLKTVELEPSHALAYYTLGIAFEKSSQPAQAIVAYQVALEHNPQNLEAYDRLAHLLAEQGEFAKAESVLRTAIALDSQQFGHYLNLGNLFLQQNQFEAAIPAYETALQLSPNHPDILHNLAIALDLQKDPIPALIETGHQLYYQGQYAAALAQYEKLLALQAADAEVYFCLNECLHKLHRGQESFAILEAGIERFPTVGKLHFALITHLQRGGQIEQAIAQAERAAQVLPEDYVFQWQRYLLLPTVYNSLREILDFRHRFAQGLQTLVQQTVLETVEQRQQVLLGLNCLTNFYLTYQGQNNRDLNQQYGGFIHRVMAAHYPHWVQPLPMPARTATGKIRVGYASHYLQSYSGTLWLTGWLRFCDRQQFEVYCYYTGNELDAITEEFRQYSDRFHHFPEDLAATCAQIRADDLHILVFPEIGMSPLTLQMAALRLAPVQCTAWGHPDTSGLPTIDYYISSELMEPAQGQDNYTETLVRLPNLAIAYPKPAIPNLTKTRTDFGLREEAILYLCCQGPFKYLPQYDYLLIEIAQRIPQSQFVFLRAESLKPRLARSFAAANLRYEDFCVFLPTLARADYLMLNLLSDVYLDTIGFSGGNTTFDAIACALPIVTCPNQLMRGRLSAAILQQIGVTETIANHETDYIEIAVRLGLDIAWRQMIKQRLSECHLLAFDDQSTVVALEAFYQQLVNSFKDAQVV